MEIWYISRYLRGNSIYGVPYLIHNFNILKICLLKGYEIFFFVELKIIILTAVSLQKWSAIFMLQR